MLLIIIITNCVTANDYNVRGNAFEHFVSLQSFIAYFFLFYKPKHMNKKCTQEYED